MKLQDTLISTDRSFTEDVEITGTVTLDPNKSVTLTTNHNIIVTGKLISKPVYPAVHTIRFTGVDESKFVGGGESVLSSDIGLWVMGNGQLDIQGEEKTAWSFATTGLIIGQNFITVQEVMNWRVGDEIVITTTVKGDYTPEERKIKSIVIDSKGVGTVTLDKPLSNNHPVVVLENGRLETAKVVNLTRNIGIEGTATGKTHVFIMSMMMQNIMYTGLRYVGPRKNTVGTAEKEPVKGRYGLHFHHCMDANEGMCVEGNVIRDSDNHSFVPHLSHGICFCDNIVYKAQETCFWNDIGDPTHGIEYDHNLICLVSFTSGSYQLEDSTSKSFGSAGFLLGAGDGNSIHDNFANCVMGAIGIDGTGVYRWPFGFEAFWKAFRNTAINCSTAGIDVWQNTAMNHTIEEFTIIYCGLAAHHGAYANDYRYNKCTFVESALFINAGSLTSLRARIENCTIIGAGRGYGDYKDIEAGIIQVGSPVDTIGDKQPPNLYRNLKFLNMNGKPEIALLGGENAHDADIVDCNITNLVTKGAEDARVQQNGQAYVQNVSGKKAIAPFAPGNFGDGDGLKVEYYSDTNFKNKVAEIIQPQANFTEWLQAGGPHHDCPGNNYSVRCTGQWIPQYTDTFSFAWAMDAGGTVTLLIEGIDRTKQFQATAGKRYNFEIRFQSLGKIPAGFSWNAKCPSMAAWYNGYETVPQSQLYTPGTVTPPPNKPPVANAGIDQVITLPINSVVLNGSGSDADGVITSYRWTGKGTIASPDKPTTAVSGLLEGDYVFTLTVTDDKGATGTDTVTITVLPAPPPVDLPPVVTATATVQVFQYQHIDLIGTANDPEGGTVSIEWRQDKGPAVTIQNKNQLVAFVDNAPIAPAGGYKFIMKVVDKGGNIVEKEVIF